MQLAHSTSNWAGSFDGVVAAPVLAAPELLEVVVLLADATPLGLFELPPHPATRTPLTSAAASTRARRERGGDVRRVLPRIWSPSRSSICAPVLRDGRLQERFAPSRLPTERLGSSCRLAQ